MSRRLAPALAILILLSSLPGCKILLGPSRGNAAASAASGDVGDAASSAGAMTQARLEAVFADDVGAILGPPGAIQGRVDGVNIYLISDSNNDRMRLLVPIASAGELNRRDLGILLQANFNRTLDARYAISDGVVYAVFQHPISSLSEELIKFAVSEVISLSNTFGTRFSAGELGIGIGPQSDS